MAFGAAPVDGAAVMHGLLIRREGSCNSPRVRRRLVVETLLLISMGGGLEWPLHSGPLAATCFPNDANQWKWLSDPAVFSRYELPRHGGSIFPGSGGASDVSTTREATYPPSGQTRRPATAALHSQRIAESLAEPQPPVMD